MLCVCLLYYIYTPISQVYIGENYVTNTVIVSNDVMPRIYWETTRRALELKARNSGRLWWTREIMAGNYGGKCTESSRKML